MVWKRKRSGAPKRSLIRRKRLARSRRYLTNVNRGLQPIAQRSIVKMKYAEAVPITWSLGSSSNVYRFNLNSIFDPNRSGTGHQPYAHDTFQTLYNRYRVIGCKWNIFTTGYSGAIQVAAQPANEELYTSSNTVSEVRENPRTKYIIQLPNASVRKLSGYTSIPSLVGRTKVQYMADDRYQAQFGASPNELAILNVVAGYMDDSSSASGQAIINIEMTYTVECFDVKHLAQS